MCQKNPNPNDWEDHLGTLWLKVGNHSLACFNTTERRWNWVGPKKSAGWSFKWFCPPSLLALAGGGVVCISLQMAGLWQKMSLWPSLVLGVFRIILQLYQEEETSKRKTEHNRSQYFVNSLVAFLLLTLFPDWISLSWKRKGKNSCQNNN